MNDSSASVSTLIERLKTGDQEAAARLWDRYFRRLHGLARARLAALRRKAAADEEDVVQSAFHDFCLAARADRYADLHGRDSLWRVLAAFVANKAKTLIDRETAAKRGGGEVQGESAFAPADTASPGSPGAEPVDRREPDPAVVVEMEERLQRFLASLNDQEARIACMRMEGRGTEEIARHVGLAPATVRRRLAVIRDVLAAHFSEEEGA